MTKIVVADVEPLVNEYKGNVAAIARKLGVSRSTVWAKVQDSAPLQKMLEDARETRIDNAESMLDKKILEGDTTALIFFLKTQGRRRGYSEKVDSTNYTLDLSQLTDEQLERLSNGEDVLSVLRA
jgi:DNA transposition AAA+ family ATPase